MKCLKWNKVIGEMLESEINFDHIASHIPGPFHKAKIKKSVRWVPQILFQVNEKVYFHQNRQLIIFFTEYCNDLLLGQSFA